MTVAVCVIEDKFCPETWEVSQTNDVCDFLGKRFGTAPDGFALYHLQVAQNCNVTPADESDWEALRTLPGPFYAVVDPEEPITISLIVGVVLAAAAVLLSFLLRPNIKTTATSVPSANNQLSDRQNSARPLQRIEDIFGEVRSTPTLIAFPYKVFEGNTEVEYDVMCVGRGAYHITDIREDTTPIEQIDRETVEIYGPDTSPLGGDAPETRIGDPITQPIVTVFPCNGTNGQTLYAPNYKSLTGNSNIVFRYPNIIRVTDASGIKWNKYFESGDTVVVTNASTTDGSHPIDLAGTYTVSSTANENRDLVLVSPDLVNSDWDTLALYPDDHTALLSPTIASSDAVSWIGPFIIGSPDVAEVWSNIIAEGGLYGIRNSDSKQEALSVDIQIGITPVDASGSPTGAEETFDITLDGSAVDRSLIGWTFKNTPSSPGPYSVRMRRSSDYNYSYAGQIVDEVKWRDCYAIAYPNVSDFGNVTTLFVRTPATPAALGVKSRKLNMLVTRRIPRRLSGGGFSILLFESKSVDDIFCAVALDPFIGRRQESELNVTQIYDAVADIKTHFGSTSDSPEAGEFGYTFDDDSTSFEETATAIAQAAFCIPTRVGSLLELLFEKATTDSTILFNHRNKLPGSEQRTSSFGYQNNNDGVEYHWVDQNNYDAPAVYRIPTDGSAANPLKIQSEGVRSFNQMYWQAWRAWNKLQYQHVGTQFTATNEASTIGLMERVLVADNTRSETQDGEVLIQDGLSLHLSQNVTMLSGVTYTIFLQLPSGTTESIAATMGTDPNEVILASAPSTPLALDADLYARAVYWLVRDDDVREQAFLVSEKTPSDNFTWDVTAINYDSRYYQNDADDPTPSGGSEDLSLDSITITFPAYTGDPTFATWNIETDVSPYPITATAFAIWYQWQAGGETMPWILRGTIRPADMPDINPIAISTGQADKVQVRVQAQDWNTGNVGAYIYSTVLDVPTN